jgi:serine/threonine-protein kinase
VLALAHQLLDVLAAAHARGVVHRDIKPENLFLTTAGSLKVLDFGVARMRDEGSALATATGARIGTPAFMPPEQALGRGDEIDARTDLWAAGATMFSLLAGRTVHTAPGAAELIVIHATTPARSLAEIAPDVPAPVCEVVDTALRFARDDRYPDAPAMQRALEEACLAAFGEPLDPQDTGPPAEPRVRVPRTEDESETLEHRRAATTQATPLSRADGAPVPRKAAEPTLDPSTSTLREGLPVRPPAPPPPAAPTSGLRRRALAAAALAAVAAAAFWIGRATPETPGAPPAASASNTSSANPAAPPGPRCTTSADCRGSAPAICRKDDGACVPLEAAGCKVLASPGDVENDATLWIGAMFPISNPDPLDYGPRSAQAIELARRDFAESTGGLLPVRPGGPKRPIAVVLCDDRDDPERVAAHLVNEVRVPAILGFARSKEVMELATSLFTPNRVLALAANTASTLQDIPPLPGGPRLVYRVTSSPDMIVPVMAAALSEIVEPAVRARPGVLAKGEELRVAVVRVGNPSGQSLADRYVESLRFNGKSVAENGANFQRIEQQDSFSSDPAELDRVAAKIRDLRPHVVLPSGGRDDLLIHVERAWPEGAGFRPHYLYPTVAIPPASRELARTRPELRRRLHAVDAVGPADIVDRFVVRHNEVHTPPTTPEHATMAPYDAFYLLAYAALAAGDQPLTGEALARAIPRLLPAPGAEPVDVGSDAIFRAQHALAAGKNIDLRGGMTSLDFDLRTGDATLDFAVYCLSPGTPAEPPRLVSSGVVFRASTRKLEGTARCP